MKSCYQRSDIDPIYIQKKKKNCPVGEEQEGEPGDQLITWVRRDGARIREAGRYWRWRDRDEGKNLKVESIGLPEK